MFCFQCQETVKNQGCTVKGVCGKENDTAILQDLLIYNLKGIGVIANEARLNGAKPFVNAGNFVFKALFTTITNTNFDDKSLIQWIVNAQKVKKELYESFKDKVSNPLDQSAQWYCDDVSLFKEKAKSVGVLATENEDVRSLRELLILGLKGICAYSEHALVLGVQKDNIYDFVFEALASTVKDISVKEMVALVLKAGEISVVAMQALDEANTKAYGNPEITEVGLGTGENPAILVSGHDLEDMHELLEQTKDTGVDVYTHGEMLPAHYYPEFKKYSHLKGNYGSSWWHQNEDFQTFNGPILLTTNCIIPMKMKNTYKDRFFTTGVASYPGAFHIEDRDNNKSKDFSQLIKIAKTCQPPDEIEKGSIVGGFAHNQVLKLADKVIEAVKSKAITRFVVMAGCDGRHKTRDYFTQLALKLPKDVVIMTAGCAKYRYNKLSLGDINGIPRVLDAGQCNDSYSLAIIALKLKEAFGFESINDLPISFDIAWYEQKAVAVLLALLHLGIKGIRLGPTIPAFISPNVLKVLVENFDIKPTTNPDDDLVAILKGE